MTDQTQMMKTASSSLRFAAPWRFCKQLLSTDNIYVWQKVWAEKTAGLPDHVPSIACHPQDGCLGLKSDKAKPAMLSPVHSIPWHVHIHDIPATVSFLIGESNERSTIQNVCYVVAPRYSKLLI